MILLAVGWKVLKPLIIKMDVRKPKSEVKPDTSANT